MRCGEWCVWCGGGACGACRGAENAARHSLALGLARSIREPRIRGGYASTPCFALGSAPLHLRAVGTCQFSRGASVAACTAYLSHFCASRYLGTGWILSPPSALPMREAWRGGGDTRRSKRRRRDAPDAAMRLRGATGGIPTKRRAPQSRMDGAPYDGCARGSRKCAEAKRREDSAKPNPKGAQASACAAGTPPKLRADRMCRAGNAAAAS